MKSKATKYKQRAINIWNDVAPFYHNRWAKNEIGPFSVTNDLIKSVRIRSGYTILDLACGTGLVTKKILAKGRNCQVYGCLLYTSPSPRDATLSRMPSSA